jgi:hypothetical protein
MLGQRHAMPNDDQGAQARQSASHLDGLGKPVGIEATSVDSRLCLCSRIISW